VAPEEYEAESPVDLRLVRVRELEPTPRVGPSSPFDPGLRLGEQEGRGLFRGSSFPTMIEAVDCQRFHNVTTGKKISTNGAGVVSINMESPSINTNAKARKGQGKPGTRIKKDPTSSVRSGRITKSGTRESAKAPTSRGKSGKVTAAATAGFPVRTSRPKLVRRSTAFADSCFAV
jgi:hypothetical protein